jgi:hypothetical protein
LFLEDLHGCLLTPARCPIAGISHYRITGFFSYQII